MNRNNVVAWRGRGGAVVPAVRHRAGTRPVTSTGPVTSTCPAYVIGTCPADVFGIHLEDSGEPETFVLAFEQKAHAVALAAALDGYKAKHGAFPPRDIRICDMDVAEWATPATGGGPTSVHVRDVAVAQLRYDLRGSGAVVSLLHMVDGEFVWEDLDTDTARETVAHALDRMMYAPEKTPETPAAPTKKPSVFAHLPYWQQREQREQREPPPQWEPKPRWPPRSGPGRTGRSVVWLARLMSSFLLWK